jgi:hypothetical protein
VNNLPNDPEAAFRYGLTVAYENVLAELGQVEATIRRELRRLSPAPLPSRLPTFPQLPQGTEGGEVR